MSFITTGGVINAPFYAGGVPYGTGSGVNMIQAGTLGQVLTSQGTNTPIWLTLSAGFANMQIFTSSGTFTTPTSKIFKVTIVGGGAGGGTGNNAQRAGNGGGGGGTAIKYYSGITAGTVCTVTIGAGGAGASSGALVQGSAGGTSSFTGTGITTLTANGGTGGTETFSTSGGDGGTATGGDLNIQGQFGSSGIKFYSTAQAGGNGGSSILGFGGICYTGTAAVNGQNGYGYGSGGAGGNTAVGAFGLAGSGTSGICIVEY